MCAVARSESTERCFFCSQRRAIVGVVAGVVAGVLAGVLSRELSVSSRLATDGPAGAGAGSCSASGRQVNAPMDLGRTRFLRGDGASALAASA